MAQLCNFIPPQLVPKLARKHGVDKKARTFSTWSHVVSMIYAHITHAIGLNDVCDALRLHSGGLSAVRGATPPARNTLSHANKVRDASFAEALLWEVLKHFQSGHPGFAGRRRQGFLKRFKAPIYAVDSTTFQLIASCMPWAQHRRRKAAAKAHVRLNMQSFLPSYAVVDAARQNDAIRAREVCAGLQKGEIVVFDKAYVDFEHLCDLEQRGVCWVTRAKDNMAFVVVEERPLGQDPSILKDQIVALEGRADRPGEFVRRIEAMVEVDGTPRLMVFLTNNLTWSPRTVCELYRARWDIEVFFKQIKQTLKLTDFLGNSANAVRWQIWTALLVYVLLRFQAFLSQWAHSFTRLFTVLRAALWERLDLTDLLNLYGTADGHFCFTSAPHQAWLPGFRDPMGQHRRPRRRWNARNL